jgi:hypothetical protein
VGWQFGLSLAVVATGAPRVGVGAGFCLVAALGGCGRQIAFRIKKDTAPALHAASILDGWVAARPQARCPCCACCAAHAVHALLPFLLQWTTMSCCWTAGPLPCCACCAAHAVHAVLPPLLQWTTTSCCRTARPPPRCSCGRGARSSPGTPSCAALSPPSRADRPPRGGQASSRRTGLLAADRPPRGGQASRRAGLLAADRPPRGGDSTSSPQARLRLGPPGAAPLRGCPLASRPPAGPLKAALVVLRAPPCCCSKGHPCFV